MSFVHFLVGLFVFLLLNFEILYSRTTLLLDMWFANKVSPTCGLAFHLPTRVLLCTAKGFDFDEVQFFLLITCAFDVILCLPNPRSYRFTPIFLSKSFTVLALTFGVFDPF